MKVIPILKLSPITPTIIFTKFEHCINDLKARLKAEQDDLEEEEWLSNQEKEKIILEKTN